MCVCVCVCVRACVLFIVESIQGLVPRYSRGASHSVGSKHSVGIDVIAGLVTSQKRVSEAEKKKQLKKCRLDPTTTRYPLMPGKFPVSICVTHVTK